tara:strand:+ start:255 stop:1397 length:1143 start_codon:yes stop_codon:yes gene_type:complete
MRHLPIGGSTAKRTIECPAWVSRSVNAPKQASSTFADEGSMLHLVMENFYDSPVSFEDQLGVTSFGDHVFSEDTLELAIMAHQAAEAVFDKYDIDEMMIEPFMEIVKDEVGGSTDMICASGDGKTVVVLDWKFGRHGVLAEDNKQGLFYTLAASLDPSTKSMLAKAERFVFAVVQPKAYGNKADVWEFGAEKLVYFYDQLTQAIEEAKSPEPKAKAGGHCHYCPAAPTCETKKLVARSALVIDPEVAATMSEAMGMVDQLEKWCKAVKAATHEALEKGGQVEGWKLVQKRASRVWTDPEAVEDKIRKAKKMKLTDGFDMKLKTAPQIEKVCKAIGYDFKSFEPLIAKVSSGTTLAPEADKRPAVGRNVISDNVSLFLESE